ncbi:MAG: M48 family metalloprotease [Candidatus Eremiobacteraeota bacterium]|nr:M48 family metalloprotease [Candidatus Eremiobacteraeota bacterium]
MNCTSLRPSRAVAFLSAIALIVFSAVRAAASPQAISAQERDWEVQVGQQAYMTYAQQGEIVPQRSSLYAVLDPVANAIAAVANRQYYVPFRFILLNEAEPNAFSMPGGNVYVTTALLSYLRNRDELAGVLCHEVNHDIHHDVYNVYQAAQRGAQPIAYERDAETNADRAGAYLCAKAGFNPWGMVWNMRHHRGAEQGWQRNAASDHPSDDQRLAALTALLTSDTATFGRFRDDIATAAPLPNARALAQSGYGGGNPTPYSMQYQSQYPPQYQSQYPAQYPAQYPSQYPAQYPSQYPAQYGPQTWSQSPQPMGPYPPPPLPACYPGC